MNYKEASYYEKLGEGKVKCRLCPHHCQLKAGQKGICRVRINEEGVLYTINYRQVTSAALDPIEKKPLYHYFPGKLILSVGTFGCNLACPFCQNYSIAHGEPPTELLDEEGLVELADHYEEQGSIGVAFTYNEPGIWYEYVYQAAMQLREQNHKVVLVTNGFIEAGPWHELLPLINAVNIDVKAFNPTFYRHHCQGDLEPVKRRVEEAARETHVEITYLLIPGENDSAEEIEALAGWLASINPNIPLHISRYHPAYKFDREATPLESIYSAYDITRKHLNYVYLGNMGYDNNHTRCPNCNEILISRNYYQTDVSGMKNGHCKNCDFPVSHIIGI
ncbi:MAG: AmmeMemoRadiSam system radical SAM enzyme [Syntrophomonadaceae bacterium]|nr:AmmeMemoRadiSam system radical SAM enzyme [Syntrophomonadaceae bacterium]